MASKKIAEEPTDSIKLRKEKTINQMVGVERRW